MSKKTDSSVEEIASSAHASKMSTELESIWSRESLLTLRTLIYLTKLVEEQNALLALLVSRFAA